MTSVFRQDGDAIAVGEAARGACLGVRIRNWLGLCSLEMPCSHLGGED